jgi:hypothetical protein
VSFGLILASPQARGALTCAALHDVVEFISPKSLKGDYSLDPGYKKLIEQLETKDAKDLLSIDIDPKTLKSSWSKHVEATDDELKDRLRIDPTLNSVSRFYKAEDAEAALRMIGKKLDEYFEVAPDAPVRSRKTAQIQVLIKKPDRANFDSERRLAITFDMGRPIGKAFLQNIYGKYPVMKDITIVTAVLQRRPHLARQEDSIYELVTLFPEYRSITP